MRILFISTFIILSLLKNDSYAQDVSNVENLFSKLKSIAPVKEQLRYDTFPAFDFLKFQPEIVDIDSKSLSYSIGFDIRNEIRSITVLIDNESIGTMEVHSFESAKIMLFNRNEPGVTDTPGPLIFYMSPQSRFIISLNKRFKYGTKYSPLDVALVHILREDLFPVCLYVVRDGYIRMLSMVDYVSGNSTVIDTITNIIVFKAEKDNQLLIKNRTSFSEDYYIPKADFISYLKPKINTGVPYWLYANLFE